MNIGLMLIFLLVLLGPLLMKKVEENLEMFLLAMGVLACVVSGVYSDKLFLVAATDPIYISVAVLVAGLVFKQLQRPMSHAIRFIKRKTPFRIFVFFMILLLGLISSVITAIIAALILVVIVKELGLNKHNTTLLTVLSCFSIGLGAALTPIGEPLSIVTISKLNEDFFFLVRLLGTDIGFALLIFAVVGAVLVKDTPDELLRLREKIPTESYQDILVRGLKIYFFVMGLTFLGAGFEPFVSTYFLELDPSVLYWSNMSSAILDNATLAAAEISPDLDPSAVHIILMGLMISGGMLVPGNIPNIIAAGKLGISSKDWAKVGLPIGLSIMMLYYLILF
ncbi:hypothetical protein FIU87_18385 [Bacillus sp. THAF10]|uniref:DUF1646 family protein n=1 Tax=Bacillus sp. THAF10 TaxID=2587848 RepID=UPI001267E6E3|nr:DUF1646 family protein [Bacillus sp. THAF10]QFT90616.1 hypothetical protein FIU87_18385 [Bacillus sp. THAF10]